MVLLASGLSLTSSRPTDAIMGALPPAKAGAGWQSAIRSASLGVLSAWPSSDRSCIRPMDATP